MFVNQNAVVIILSKPSRVACERSLFEERMKNREEREEKGCKPVDRHRVILEHNPYPSPLPTRMVNGNSYGIGGLKGRNFQGLWGCPREEFSTGLQKT